MVHFFVVALLWIGFYMTSTGLERKIFEIRALSVSMSSLSLEALVIIVDLVVLSWSRINAFSGTKKDKIIHKFVISLIIIKNLILFLIIVGNIIISFGNWSFQLTIAWTILFQVFSFIDLYITWTLFITMNIRTTSFTKGSSSTHVIHVHQKVCSFSILIESYLLQEKSLVY